MNVPSPMNSCLIRSITDLISVQCSKPIYGSNPAHNEVLQKMMRVFAAIDILLYHSFISKNQLFFPFKGHSFEMRKVCSCFSATCCRLFVSVWFTTLISKFAPPLLSSGAPNLMWNAHNHKELKILKNDLWDNLLKSKKLLKSHMKMYVCCPFLFSSKCCFRLFFFLVSF